MNYITGLFLGGLVFVSMAGCMKPKVAMSDRFPVVAPVAAAAFEFSPVKLNDCRILMFRDGGAEERAAYMHELIQNSLKIYDNEITAAKQSREQVTVRQKITEKFSAPGLLTDDDRDFLRANFMDSEKFESSEATVTVPTSPDAKDYEPFALQQYFDEERQAVALLDTTKTGAEKTEVAIALADSTSDVTAAAEGRAQLLELKAKHEKATHDVARFKRAKTDGEILKSLADDEKVKSANRYFLLMHKEGVLADYEKWVDYQFKVTQLDGSPLSRVDASTRLYNYLREGIRIQIGKDASGSPSVSIFDWKLNAISEASMRESADPGDGDLSYGFVTENAEIPATENNVRRGVTDVAYEPKGGVYTFNVTTPSGAKFAFKFWRSRYGSSDGRIYYQGEVTRTGADGSTRRGTLRFIDKTITDLYKELNASA